MKTLRLPDPGTLGPRKDGSLPHRHLVVQPGATRRLCDFRSISLDLMTRHMSKEHRRKSDQKTWLRDEVSTGISFQNWTQGGRRAYWIVRDDSHNDIATVKSTDGSPRRKSRVAALHEEEHQRLKDRSKNASNTDTGIDDPTFTSSWMKRMGWAVTFHSVNRSFLVKLRDSPAVSGYPLLKIRCSLLVFL